MKQFTKQLLFIAIAVAVITAGGLAIQSATPSGFIKVKPSATPKLKVAISRTEVATPQSVGNPVGWWKMDEGTAIHGTLMADSSGYGNTGTLSTGDGSLEKSVAGKLGGALSFDGVDDYVNCGTNSSLKPTTAISVAFWMRPSAIKGDQFPVSVGDTGVYGWLFDYTSNNIKFWVGNGTSRNNSTAVVSPSTGSWHYIVGTYNNSTIKIYVNGVEMDSDSIAGPINYSGITTCYIGSSKGLSADRFFNGLIDDVRIYNRALTAGEVAQQYNSTKSGYLGKIKVSTGLVGYWKLDDNSALTSVIDYSGKGNTGTAYRGTATSTSVFSTSTAMIGRAFGFNGVNDWVDAGARSSLNITGAITLSAWIKSQNDPTKYTVMVGKLFTEYEFMLMHNTSLRIFKGSGASYEYVGSSGFSSIANLWTFVAVTINGSTYNFYKNGVNVGTGTFATPFDKTGSNNLNIGRRSGYNSVMNFNGLIDEVKIWSYARSAEQIKQDYERGLRGLP